MLIRILIERAQPVAGTAVTEGQEPLHFDGWLELLRVLSELVTPAPSGGGAVDADRPSSGSRMPR